MVTWAQTHEVHSIQDMVRCSGLSGNTLLSNNLSQNFTPRQLGSQQGAERRPHLVHTVALKVAAVADNPHPRPSFLNALLSNLGHSVFFVGFI